MLNSLRASAVQLNFEELNITNIKIVIKIVVREAMSLVIWAWPTPGGLKRLRG